MGKYRSLGTLFNRVFRNDLNANFNDVDADVKAVDSRVTNIITNNPQPSEVVDARGGKAVLKDRLDAVDVSLTEKVSYPVLSLEGSSVVRKDLMYGHVERYGAVADDTVDSTAAIQKAADVVHALSKGVGVWAAGAFKLELGSGNYKITKTIKLYYDPTTFSKDAPITITGQKRKRVADKLGTGTVIRPLIPNHDNKTYANAFSINIKYNTDADEDDSIAFNSQPLQTINSISMENLSFTLTDTEAATYNICAVKGYRFRIDAKNLLFTNMWRGIWQPEKDRNNLYNYCDFSTYENLSFTYTKLNCLELYTPDCSSIKSVYNHRPKSTFDSVIKVTRGSITIDDVTHSLHGDYDTNGVFVPRNDGTGQTGTKAVIKLVECGASVRNVYCERPLTDYVFHLTDVINFSLDDYRGKFVGNGFLSINGTCRNIEIKNIFRNENLVSEYTDFYVSSGASFTGLKVKNFVPRTYYSDSIALATSLTGLTAYTDSAYNTRDIKHNFTLSHYKHIEGETITFLLKYDGATWTTTDIYGNSMTNALGTFAWSTDAVSFVGTKLSPCRVASVQEGYVDASTLSHIPVIRGANTEKIRFFDRSSGTALSSPDTKCCVWVTVSCILNMTKLP